MPELRRNLMRNYFFLATFISSSCFANGYPINLEGHYKCAGNEVGTNEAYKCNMTIKKTGETYASTASCTDGNSYSGTGIYDENSHRLSTGFINPKKSEETGVSVTNIRSDGRLSTVWTYLNNTSVGHVKCVKQK